MICRLPQILPEQNTDFVHFFYTNIFYWPLNLYGKKKPYCAKTPTEPIDRIVLLSAPNPNSACNNQSSRGFGALLKGLTSVVDNSCRSRDSDPQPRVTSPTLYPLEPRLPTSSHDCPPVGAVRALIGTPPAGGALGDRLACLCLETVLLMLSNHSRGLHLGARGWTHVQIIFILGWLIPRVTIRAPMIVIGVSRVCHTMIVCAAPLRMNEQTRICIALIVLYKSHVLTHHELDYVHVVGQITLDDLGDIKSRTCPV